MPDTKIQFIGKFVYLISLVLFISCSEDKVTSPDSTYPGMPEELDDGWQVMPMQLKNMDRETILTLSNRIENGEYGQVRSLIISRGDHLVFDKYYLGRSPDQVNRCYSVTKSVVSTLVGIAIDQGFISGVDAKISDYLTKYELIFRSDSIKNQLTLEHILMMAAGLEWNELAIPYSNSANDWNLMTASDDYIKYTLEKPIVVEPGTRFNYNSGCTVILGEILYQATGRHIDSLATEWLFEPMGISEYEWRYISANDMPHPASGLSLRPRDMAKFGKLFLDGGIWDGAQLVPAKWVEQATAPKIPIENSTSYGYQWWTASYTRIPQPGVEETQFIKFALGYAGQYIILVPVNDLVIVLTGGNGEAGTDMVDIVFSYILNAVLE
ncbi:MAG: class C beta-lactamase-related serine hydrolase [Calditrichaeota bacterium]|nr:MAG: class C beta-lactamase-related serine hydrolase [Calditrichota bacterium]